MEMNDKDFRRFMTKFHRDGSCWIWHGGKFDTGYSAIKISGKQKLGHRVSYEHFVGPIPPGLHLDHLCRRKSCVSPFHLEPVTCMVNTLRGVGPSAKNAVKSSCVNGHEFTPENTYRFIDRNGSLARSCKACRHRLDLVNRAKRKAARGSRPRTHCIHGHELSGDNIRIFKWKTKTQRICISCEKARTVRRAAERRKLKSS